MTRTINVGGVAIGGGAPVAVQSMLSHPSGDVPGNVAEAVALEAAGCDILRMSVPDEPSVETFRAVRAAIHIPLVADIHFDYRLALAALGAGADKIRINPGNIGGEDRVAAVLDACRGRGVPIRIGVNSGSVPRELLHKYGGPTPEALCEAAWQHIAICERHDFHDIVISLKASNVRNMAAAYRLMASQCDFPLHLGVTEAGTREQGIIKSAIGIGSLLLDGIGDTLRVSLTGSTLDEVAAGRGILRSLRMLGGEPELVSCPTCGRTKIDLVKLAQEVEERLKSVHKPITVAVMGCVVNGPGEAREADVGIAGGDGEGLLFRKGEIVGKLPEGELVPALFRLIDEL